jgi:hypothetical protein
MENFKVQVKPEKSQRSEGMFLAVFNFSAVGVLIVQALMMAGLIGSLGFIPMVLFVVVAVVFSYLYH